MRDRPSLTASVVSFARGVAGQDRGAASSDPLAGALLPQPFAALLRGLERGGAAAAPLRRLVRRSMFGLSEHLELRTALLDDALVDAVEAGCGQVVILGAGLDARAFRLDALSQATVFEVDHPATQAYKRSRVARDDARAAALEFVGVDFERESLGDALADAGHDASRPTAWLWEGVTPYLAPEAIDATLAALAARSAPGSRLAMSYVTPEIAFGPGARSRPGFRLLLRAIGEPLRGILTPDEARSKVEAVGFRLLSDHHPFELSVVYRGKLAPRAGPAERVLVAERPRS